MFEHFGINDILDICLVAIILYSFFRLLNNEGTTALFLGILTFVGLAVIVHTLKMRMMGAIFQQIGQAAIFIIVILFQDEIRRSLISLGSHTRWAKIVGLFTPKPKNAMDRSGYATSIVMACMNMSKTKTGALIVVEDKIHLGLYEQTGEFVNADISARLLESLFFKNSPLHDGAVIIGKKKIIAAGCILPVSQNPNIPKDLGLRHRSGLGISQETDARVIIVSEERGKISTARHGKISLNVELDELQNFLTKED